MCLAHRKYSTEWKSSVLATPGYLPWRTFQVIWLGMPASECSLVPALFTTTADLAFGGNSGALFSDFLAAGAQCCQELKLHCRASAHTVACFLVLSLFGSPIQGERKTPRKLFIFFSMLSVSSSFMKGIYIMFEKGKSSPDSWVLSSRSWCCQELVWPSQFGLVLSCWWHRWSGRKASDKITLWPG